MGFSIVSRFYLGTRLKRLGWSHRSESELIPPEYLYIYHCIIRLVHKQVTFNKNMHDCFQTKSTFMVQNFLPSTIELVYSCSPLLRLGHMPVGGIHSKERHRPWRSSAVRRWLPTAAAQVRVRAACGVCGGQSGTGAGFLRVLRFPLPIIPPISPLS
jgi:hypothetical protein